MNYLIDNYIDSLYLTEDEFLVEKIDFSSISKWYTKKLTVIESELKKYKIDINGLKNLGKSLQNKIDKLYEEGKSPKEAADSLKPAIIGKIKSELKKVQSLGVGKQILISVVGFMMIYIMNTTLFSYFIILFGPTIGFILLATIIAPVTEETLKKYYIEKGMPYTGTAITFGLEFLNYIASVLLMGEMGLVAAILMRVPAYIMHFMTTFLQKKIGKTDSQFPSEQEKKRKIAWVVAILFHSLFNAVALAITI